MSRRLLSLLLAFSLGFCDGVPISATSCWTTLQTVDSLRADTTLTNGSSGLELEDPTVPNQPVRQVLSEPMLECDADDLNVEPHIDSPVCCFRFEFCSAACRPVLAASASRVSIHLRI